MQIRSKRCSRLRRLTLWEASRRGPRFLLLVLLIGAVLIGLDAAPHLRLVDLQARHTELQQAFAHAPLAVAGLFFVSYVLAATLAFPIMALFTVMSGAIFGFGLGLVLASFASTLGATLSFLCARYALRRWVMRRVMRRWRARWRVINAQVAQHGAWYLLSLRLMPVAPFFLINALMGLTRMRARTFALVSQLGMLPATAVYVNAGGQLGQLRSLRDIANPSVLWSLALLAVFALLAKPVATYLPKWGLARWQRFVRYRPWRALRPKRFDRNLIVIGAGAGGLVSAYIAAAVRAKVTLIESHHMGGDCLNHGCVPSKALIAAAQNGLSFEAAVAHVQRAIAAIAPHDSADRYTALGVEVLEGHAHLLSPWHVRINDQTLSARSIILATGSAPTIPSLPGLDQVPYLTSETLWPFLVQCQRQLQRPPGRLLILGGGAAACELACALARLGSQVTVVERAARLLSREDPEVSEAARQTLMCSNVAVLTNAQAQRIDPKTRTLGLLHRGASIALPFDALLIAVGRTPRLEGYGLETLGIALADPPNSGIATNGYLQTSYPNIFAVGDVASYVASSSHALPRLTHVAAHEAWYATVNALFGVIKRFEVDARVVPRVLFLHPEIACVGLRESQARAQKIRYDITRYDLEDFDRAIVQNTPALTERAEPPERGRISGFVKVITARNSDNILGVTIVADRAAEMLQEFVLAMKCNLGLRKILSTMHPYPTWTEANKYAAGRWQEARKPRRLLRLAQRFHAWRRG